MTLPRTFIAFSRQNGSTAHVKTSAVKPVSRDRSHEGPTASKDHYILTVGPTLQSKGTCHQRPPVLRDNIFSWPMQDRFRDRFYCNGKMLVDIRCKSYELRAAYIQIDVIGIAATPFVHQYTPLDNNYHTFLPINFLRKTA